MNEKNSNSEYWDRLKNDNFGETLDERFLYILCSDYERYEDMVVGKEVDVNFYQERLDSLLRTKESQLEKLVQIHANEIIKHRKRFYESVDLNYANRKYSTTNTLSSMILHPEVEKILMNGRLMNPSQHGIPAQNKGNINIGTMEDVADAIKKKLNIRDDEPIIGRDELYRQYYSELDQIKECQEKELGDFLAFYKGEQEYFERCIIKVKKHDKALLPTISFNNDRVRAEYKAKLGVQGDKEVPLDNPKKSKITFVNLGSDQSSSSMIESSTSDDVTSVQPVSLSNVNNMNQQVPVTPKTVPIVINEQQVLSNPPSINTSPFNSTPSIPNANNTRCPFPSPLLQPSTANPIGNNLLNNLNPGAIQILNMLGSTIQQDNVNMDEVLKFAGMFFGGQGGSQ